MEPRLKSIPLALAKQASLGLYIYRTCCPVPLRYSARHFWRNINPFISPWLHRCRAHPEASAVSS